MDWRQFGRTANKDEGKRPAFRPGDQIRVWYKIQEKDRVRTAPFEGIVVRLRGGGPAQTFTVRRVTFGEGVERIFFTDGPGIDRIEVLRQGSVKRSRLYYLRTVIGKTKIAAKEPDAGQAAGAVKPAESIAAVSERSANAAATASQPSGSEAQP